MRKFILLSRHCKRQTTKRLPCAAMRDRAFPFRALSIFTDHSVVRISVAMWLFIWTCLLFHYSIFNLCMCFCCCCWCCCASEFVWNQLQIGPIALTIFLLGTEILLGTSVDSIISLDWCLVRSKAKESIHRILLLLCRETNQLIVMLLWFK